MLMRLWLIFLFISLNGQVVWSHQALIEAVRARDITKLQALLDMGIDPSSTNQSGMTALIVAVSHCYVEGMEVLLRAGADINATNNYGSTPLIIASFTGCDAGLELLLNWAKQQQKVIDLNHQTEKGNTALELAVANRHTTVMQLLLDAGADLNYVNARGANVFTTAMDSCDIETIQVLLMHNRVDIHAVNNDEESYLLIAAKEGCVPAVRWLLDMDLDIDLPDQEGRTPLLAAIDVRVTALEDNRRMNLLIFPIDDPEVNVEAYTEVMEVLLKAGANPDAMTYRYRFTPLMLVAMENDMEGVELLLSYNADPDPTITNSLGYSAILYANDNNYKDVAQRITKAIEDMQK